MECKRGGDKNRRDLSCLRAETEATCCWRLAESEMNGYNSIRTFLERFFSPPMTPIVLLHVRCAADSTLWRAPEGRRVPHDAHKKYVVWTRGVEARYVGGPRCFTYLSAMWPLCGRRSVMTDHARARGLFVVSMLWPPPGAGRRTRVGVWRLGFCHFANMAIVRWERSQCCVPIYLFCVVNQSQREADRPAWRSLVSCFAAWPGILVDCTTTRCIV